MEGKKTSRIYISAYLLALAVLLASITSVAFGAQFTQWEPNPVEGTHSSTYVIYTQTSGQPTQGNNIFCYLDTSYSTFPPLDDYIEIWLKDPNGDNIRGYVLGSEDANGIQYHDIGGISKSIYLLSETRIDSIEVTLHATGSNPILNTGISSVKIEHNAVFWHVDSTELTGTDISWDFTQSDGGVAVAKGYIHSVSGWAKHEDSDIELYNYRVFTIPSDWPGNTAAVRSNVGYVGVYDSTASSGIGYADAGYGIRIDAGVSRLTPGSLGWGAKKNHTLTKREKNYSVASASGDAALQIAGWAAGTAEIALNCALPVLSAPIAAIQVLLFAFTQAVIDDYPERNPISENKIVTFFDVSLYPGQTYTSYLALYAGTYATAEGVFAGAQSYVDFLGSAIYEPGIFGLYPTFFAEKVNDVVPRGLFLGDALVLYRLVPRPQIQVDYPENGYYCDEGDTMEMQFRVMGGEPNYLVVLGAPDLSPQPTWDDVGSAGMPLKSWWSPPSYSETELTDHAVKIIAADSAGENCTYTFNVHVVPQVLPVDNLECNQPASSYDYLTFEWVPNDQNTLHGYEFWVSDGPVFTESKQALIRCLNDQGGFIEMDSFVLDRNMSTCQVYGWKTETARYGLKPDTTYYFWVVVKDRWENTVRQDAQGATVGYPDINSVLLQQPTDPNITRSSVVLSWSQSDQPLDAYYSAEQDYSFHYYEIWCAEGLPTGFTALSSVYIHDQWHWNPGEDYYNLNVNKMTTRSTTACEVHLLQAGTTFYFKVWVVDKSGNGVFSNVVQITTDPAPVLLEADIGPSQVIFIDETASFHAQAWGGTPNYTYKWDFNASDGVDWNNPDIISGPTSSGMCDVDHNYPEYGRYTVNLQVTDACGVEAFYPKTWCSVSVIPYPPQLTPGAFCHFADGRTAPSFCCGQYMVDPLLWYGWSSGYPGDSYPNYHNFDSYVVHYRPENQPWWYQWETITDPNQQICSDALTGLEPDTVYDFAMEVCVRDFEGGLIGNWSNLLKILTDKERVALAFYNVWFDDVQVMADGQYLGEPLEIVKRSGEPVEIRFEIANYGETAVEPYASSNPPVKISCFHHMSDPSSEFYQLLGFSDVEGLVGLEPGPQPTSGETFFRWLPSQKWMGYNTIELSIGGPFEGVMRNTEFLEHDVRPFAGFDFSLNLILDNTKPDPVIDLEVTDKAPTSITLNWTSPADHDDGGFNLLPEELSPDFYEYVPPGGTSEPNVEPEERPISYYDIRYSTQPAGDAEGLYVKGTRYVYWSTVHISGETENCTIEGLAPDTRYYFVVAAFDQSGNPATDYSNIVEATTMDIVNFRDFAELAFSWFAELGQPNYNEMVDFDADGVVDMNDLDMFTSEWLQIIDPNLPE